MDVRRVRVQARRAAAQIEVMRDGRAEPDQVALEKYRREQEDVRQVLAAMEGVVVDVEVAFFERFRRKQRCAGLEGRADRSELHRNEFGLGDDIAVPV